MGKKKEAQESRVIQLKREPPKEPDMICPVGFATPLMEQGSVAGAPSTITGWLRPPCAKAMCPWWDTEDESCAVLSIAQTLNDMHYEEMEARRDGDEWKERGDTEGE